MLYCHFSTNYVTNCSELCFAIMLDLKIYISFGFISMLTACFLYSPAGSVEEKHAYKESSVNFDLGPSYLQQLLSSCTSTFTVCCELLVSSAQFTVKVAFPQ